jgi:hypothetical protein
MEHLDSATVLAIIQMMDNNIRHRKNAIQDILCFEDVFFAEGAVHGLEQFRDHLQFYIEGQLNAIENSTGE